MVNVLHQKILKRRQYLQLKPESIEWPSWNWSNHILPLTAIRAAMIIQVFFILNGDNSGQSHVLKVGLYSNIGYGWTERP